MRAMNWIEWTPGEKKFQKGNEAETM